ncbi:acyltransferase family protein [Rhodalgimonas zhirmunskyi]|uniref:Acyltransferase n=1 Tax=Rhodalgimonas zhirmunskyi TaxID=2964767 RepID=A0AAJ1X581_9RHOB|nr:acyltransferase family protein [Rhodoalgimonas zhirmunskyi]MDQ2094281.1 acyltransferase [Rhodoalgimonas zhirmunskyi]
MSNLTYRPEIDGLRAIAVLAVILFHAGFETLSGGYVGVDVFFVISGYLITSLVLKDIAEGSFSFARFYERRIRRLLPAMFIVVLLTIPFAYALMLPTQFKDFMGSVFANSLFLSNVYFLTQVEYFQPGAELSPLLHTWSLSIEEQYYLIFPAIALLLARKSRGPLLVAVLAFVLWGVWMSYTGVTDDPGKNYFHTLARLWEIGAGSLCAFVPPRARSKGASALAALGLVLIFASITLFGEATPFPSLYTLVPIIGTMLVVLFGASDRGVGRALSLRPVVFIGLLSYSAYLWHQPLFALARLWAPTDPGPLALTGLTALTFVLAFLSWKFIEQPVRFGLGWRAIRRGPLFAMSFAALSGFAALGLAGYLTDGFLSLRSNGAALTRIEARIAPNWGLAKNCSEDSQACKTDPAPKVLLWGDSFAMHLAPALLAADPAMRLEQRTLSGCAPLPGIAFLARNMLPSVAMEEAADCFALNDAALDLALTSPTIETVVLSSPFEFHAKQLWSKDGSAYAQDAAPAAIAPHLHDTIARLKAAGRRVILVSPTPESGFDPGQCAAKALRFDRPDTACDFPLSTIHNAPVFDMLAAGDTSGQGASAYVDLRALICPDATCDVIRDDPKGGKVMLYRDGGHLSVEGARALGPDFRRALGQP